MSTDAPRGVVARARRFWQAQPGAPNVLSTAGSFSPPVGSLIGNDAGSGYYIDFRLKAVDAKWPTDWLLPPDREFHVATAQFGLGCLERYHHGEGEEWLETAIKVAGHLLSGQDSDGAWPHGMRMPHTYYLLPPWISAMAQGEGASVLIRLHAITGDERYREAAIKAMLPMDVPTSSGGARAQLGGGYFPEEYPTEPGSYVLNGALFALWGLATSRSPPATSSRAASTPRASKPWRPTSTATTWASGRATTSSRTRSETSPAVPTTSCT